MGKFIAITKNKRGVEDVGLKRNSAGYEIMHIEKIDLPQSKNERKYTFRVIIKSTFDNAWVGKYSVLDSEINQSYNNFLKNTYSLRL